VLFVRRERGLALDFEHDVPLGLRHAHLFRGRAKPVPHANAPSVRAEDVQSHCGVHAGLTCRAHHRCGESTVVSGRATHDLGATLNPTLIELAHHPFARAREAVSKQHRREVSMFTPGCNFLGRAQLGPKVARRALRIGFEPASHLHFRGRVRGDEHHRDSTVGRPSIGNLARSRAPDDGGSGDLRRRDERLTQVEARRGK
jgi:hypothetical protein